MVVIFHIFETFSAGDHVKQIINHGYLAVDFFFMLSGYVISYAYDNRWNQMTTKDFFIRRLVRLQPMIIMGSLVGASLFYFQHSEGMGWGGIATTPFWKLILVMLIGMTVIPVSRGLDIRGWGEMHPLNGPAWSLFYEYIANIVYALILRRVSKIVLVSLVLISAGFTLYYAFTNPNGDMIGGWAIDDPVQLKIGFTRLALPFLMGIFLARTIKLRYIKHAFIMTSVLLIAILAFPRLGGYEMHELNALYECVVLMILFPVIILLGAGGKVIGEKANLLCSFFGHISYPLYITHFPLVNVYMAWVVNGKHTLEEPITWIVGVIVVLASIILAYMFMKFYDIPVRKWLNKKLIASNNK